VCAFVLKIDSLLCVLHSDWRKLSLKTLCTFESISVSILVIIQVLKFEYFVNLPFWLFVLTD